MTEDDAQPADGPAPFDAGEPSGEADPDMMLSPGPAQAVSDAMGTLVRTLTGYPDTLPLQAMQVYRGGPTIEHVVREEIRPLLKAWLDAHLPAITERLVNEQLEQIAGRVVR